MIIDVNRNGVEIYHNDELFVVRGNIDECADHIFNLTLDEIKWNSSKELYQSGAVYLYYNGKCYIQNIVPKIDFCGNGMALADYFNKIGFVYSPLKIHKLGVFK